MVLIFFFFLPQGEKDFDHDEGMDEVCYEYEKGKPGFEENFHVGSEVGISARTRMPGMARSVFTVVRFFNNGKVPMVELSRNNGSDIQMVQRSSIGLVFIPKPPRIQKMMKIQRAFDSIVPLGGESFLLFSLFDLFSYSPLCRRSS